MAKAIIPLHCSLIRITLNLTMCERLTFVVSIFLLCAVITECSKWNDMDCPPWTILNETSNNCECGRDLDGIVQYNSETLEVSVKAL